MNSAMSYPDWKRAQGHLAVVRQYLARENRVELIALTEEAKRILEIDCNPAEAALELEQVVKQLPLEHPTRQSVVELAAWLFEYRAVAALGASKDRSEQTEVDALAINSAGGFF